MFGDAMKWLDGERILYGSAWPCYNMKQGISDLERFNFSEEHKEKFFYKNAEKLLGMKLV
jgi:predicted TIM-barrel fold metal-dependent hydrolase